MNQNIGVNTVESERITNLNRVFRIRMNVRPSPSPTTITSHSLSLLLFYHIFPYMQNVFEENCNTWLYGVTICWRWTKFVIYNVIYLLFNLLFIWGVACFWFFHTFCFCLFCFDTLFVLINLFTEINEIDSHTKYCDFTEQVFTEALVNLISMFSFQQIQ